MATDTTTENTTKKRRKKYTTARDIYLVKLMMKYQKFSMSAEDFYKEATDKTKDDNFPRTYGRTNLYKRCQMLIKKVEDEQGVKLSFPKAKKKTKDQELSDAIAGLFS
jgi:hypothetical protein